MTTIWGKKANWIGCILIHDWTQKTVIERKRERQRGKRRRSKECWMAWNMVKYKVLKNEAQERRTLQKQFDINRHVHWRGKNWILWVNMRTVRWLSLCTVCGSMSYMQYTWFKFNSGLSLFVDTIKLNSILY